MLSMQCCYNTSHLLTKDTWIIIRKMRWCRSYKNFDVNLNENTLIWWRTGSSRDRIFGLQDLPSSNLSCASTIASSGLSSKCSFSTAISSSCSPLICLSYSNKKTSFFISDGRGRMMSPNKGSILASELRLVVVFMEELAPQPALLMV